MSGLQAKLKRLYLNKVVPLDFTPKVRRRRGRPNSPQMVKRAMRKADWLKHLCGDMQAIGERSRWWEA